MATPRNKLKNWKAGSVSRESLSQRSFRDTSVERGRSNSLRGEFPAQAIPQQIMITSESNTPRANQALRKLPISNKLQKAAQQQDPEMVDKNGFSSAIWMKISETYPHLRDEPNATNPSELANFIIEVSFTLFSRENDDLKADRKRLESEVAKRIGDLDGASVANGLKLRDLEHKHRETIAAMTDRMDEFARRCRDDANDKQKWAHEKHTMELEEAKRSFYDQIQELETAHEETISKHMVEVENFKSQRSSMEKEMHEIQHYCDNEMQRLMKAMDKKEHELLNRENRHLKSMEDQEQSWNAKLREREDQYSKSTREKEQSWKADQAQLNQVHQDTLGRLKEDMTKSLQDVQMRHAKEIESLRQEAEELDEALWTQKKDTIPAALIFSEEDNRGKSDVEIGYQFLVVADIIESLARTRWNREHAVWTDQILQDLTTKHGLNSRVLKKGILQNSIWTVLMHHVFCSPFRPFGEEGLALETEWNEKCGKDPDFDNGIYTWPTPGILTERWRYFTIKQCREALKQPLPSEWDPRFRLKKAFKAKLTALKSELSTMLMEIVDLDDSRIIHSLASKALSTWLEFQLQRCRIVVSMPASSLEPAESMVKKAQDGSLMHLEIVPSLRRYGNIRGVGLDTHVVITNFTGQNIKIAQEIL